MLLPENFLSKDTQTFTTLVELLRHRAQSQPLQIAFTFLKDGETEELNLTYQELDQQARSIGALLQSLKATGERALLLYPPGLEFIAAFFGCLYAGVIAVPAYPPRRNQRQTRLLSIVRDSQAKIALSTTSVSSSIELCFCEEPELAGLNCVATDNIASNLASDWQEVTVTSDTLAFLQYTSGSTGSPKGVMVSHGNVLYNSEYMKQAFELTPDSVSVSWLPSFHDMGLIDGVLQPVYTGFRAYLMAPVSFLQQPIRWLQAISRYKATHSGGPNFAFELCVEKMTRGHLETLDLSSWVTAYNGAEPVRKNTLDQFAEIFKSSGFRVNCFYPCYGLAEGTLMVSGGLVTEEPITYAVEAEQLEINRVVKASFDHSNVRYLIGSGRAWIDTKIVIVNPQALTCCKPDEVGEIWVSSSSNAQGYWNRIEVTEQTFGAYLADTGEGPFMRTGDLGFLKDGELFVTGRMKDVIIIRGRNHYPQDIELSVEQSHPALRVTCSAAFSVDVAGTERLAIAVEVERTHLRNLNVAEVVRTIRQAIAEHHEIDIYAILLLKTGSIPKTSSGKIQRHAARDGFLNGSLDIVGDWVENLQKKAKFRNLQAEVETLEQQLHSSLIAKDDNQRIPTQLQKAKTIETWLASKIAERISVDPTEIDLWATFATYGLDSVAAVGIAGELENWLQQRLSPTLLYDYPCIAALAKYLTQEETKVSVGSKSTFNRKTETEAIAIIGMSCRFPSHVRTPEEFWQLLQNGVNAITEVDNSRWEINALYDPQPASPGKMSTRWGGFLEQVDKFDPQFFGISPREAEGMDPQQRLMVEVAWEALENAGQAPDKLAGSQTGVFIGISTNDYSRLQFEDSDRINAYSGTGIALSIAANRLSYLLDLRGPSLAVDTACSSSLVSVHLACQSLQNGECNLALAGGVNLILSPELTITFSQARMMASDGRCKTFDANADGYVRGEGCGIIVLKGLGDALQNGDNILAVIKGSAVNQDGRSNGLTAPNGPAQQAVIKQALEKAGVQPSQISYVETHGTGTPLGDPIEFESLKAVLMQGRSLDQPCTIGSVKTNIGHLEAAAGIAGLMKVVLSMQHKAIPPHLHLQQINPHISLENTPLSIPKHLQPWDVGSGRRIAGVSSFGFGGTNAHIILEEAPVLASTANEVERPRHILTLSAKSENALKLLADNYQAITCQDASLADICFTANTGRSPSAHRASFVAASTDELSRQLQAFVDGKLGISGVFAGQLQSQKRHKIVFLFTGQGCQYIGMARQLYQTQPTFRNALEQCDELLRPYLDGSLLSVLYPADNTADLLNQTAYTQPVLFALEYALAQLWLSWGIIPDAVIGHSLGEYVAACVAGVFSLEDGLKLIAERSRLMQSLPQNGMMAAIFADIATVEGAIAPYKEHVCIAAVNGVTNIVISGVRESIETAIAQLQAQQITVQVLNVSHPFHSSLMNPILDEFEQKLCQVQFAPLKLPLASNLTGEILQPGEMLGLSYWRRHLRSCVQFASGIEALAAQGYDLFIEVGSHPTLIGMGKRCLRSESLTWLPSLKKEQDDWQILLNSLGELYVRGVDISWAGFDQDYLRCRIPLPTYPFERQRYWLEPAKKENRLKHTHKNAVHPLLGTQYLAALQIFESQLDTHKLPYLAGHQVQGAVVLPVAAYLEMANAAVTEAFKLDSYSLVEVALLKMLSLSADTTKTVQTVLLPAASGETTFQVFSLQTATEEQPTEWTLHVNGKIQTSSSVPVTTISINEVRSRCTNQISPAEFYQNLDSLGVKYDELLQGIEELWQHQGEALAKVRLAPTLLAETKAYRIHPALLDSCLQVFVATLPTEGLDTHRTATYVPVRVGSMRIWCQPPTQLWSYARLHPNDNGDLNAFEGDVVLLDETGLVFAEIKGIGLQRVQLDAQPVKQNNLDDWFYELQWQAKNITGLAADYILQPEEISDRIQPQIIQLIDQLGLKNYEELLTQLDTLSVVYVLRAFEQLGCQFSRHQQISVLNLAQEYGVIPQHHRLLARMLEILQEEGVLNKVSEHWEVDQLPKDLNLQVQSPEALLTQYPKADAELVLLQRCGEHLAQVLRGECDAVELLFAEGSLSTTERLYQDSPSARLNNTLVQFAIATALSNLPANRKVRILEIGAGTGGTTAYILSKLPSDQVEYVFTDISYAFTAKAEQKFRDYPFVQYKLLNIEREPLAQGFAPQEFDLILAANVIHATSDLRRTLGHIQQILAPEGMLVLLEATAKSRLLDLIFGLTEGWWKFDDPDLRPTYPLLSSYQWRSLLLEMGFSSTISLPQTGEAKQSVILARSAIPTQRGAIASQTQQLEGRWLIFADQGGIGQQLGEVLKTQGQSSILVYADTDYNCIDSEHFGIRPEQPQDMQQLLEMLLAANQSHCQGIIHLWSLDAVPTEKIDVASLESAQLLGCGSVLHLIQGLQRIGWQESSGLWLVTQGSQPVGEFSSLEIAQSPLWGFGRAIAQEYASCWGGMVDLDPNFTIDEAATSLWTEISNSDGEDQLAFRQQQRYVARLVRKPLENNINRIELQPHVSYLITGGLGDLGLLVARWMVEQGARQLILLGRTQLPARELWNSVDANSRQAVQIATIQELEALGASIHCAAIDVGDADRMSAFVQEWRDKEYPPIRGVVHAAGFFQPQTLQSLDLASLNAVFQPKVAGGWVLHQLFAEDNSLDFCLFFSSGAAFMPVGQSNYAAANVFLDTLAHHRKAQGQKALSINWGPWSDVGMAAKLSNLERLEMRGIGSMTPKEGLTALESLFSQNLTQVAVMPIDLRQMREFNVVSSDLPLFAQLFQEVKDILPKVESVQLEAVTQNILLAGTPEAAQQMLESYLSKKIAKSLGLTTSKLDIEQPLNNLGFDSLMAAELKSRIQSDLGVSLPIANFMQGVSLVQLASQISDLLPKSEQSDDWEEGQL